MIQPEVVLVSPTDALRLDAAEGWGIVALDLGDPEVRSESQNAPDADGTLDFTQFTGARTLTLGLELVEVNTSMWDMVTRLKTFLRPRVPCKFRLKLDDNSPQVQADVRRGPWQNPLDQGYIEHPVAQWVVPKGIFESVTPTVTTINPAGVGTELGRTYDRTYDRVYPASPVLGSAVVTNTGNVDAYPLLRVYGPCTNPTLINDTQAMALIFSGLTVNAGEFVEIDTRYKTIRYLGLPSDSRYNNLTFGSSRWWSLSPKQNSIRFVPATFGAGSILEMTHYNAFDI